MLHRFACPSCQAEFEQAIDGAAEPTHCPHCQAVFSSPLRPTLPLSHSDKSKFSSFLEPFLKHIVHEPAWKPFLRALLMLVVSLTAAALIALSIPMYPENLFEQSGPRRSLFFHMARDI
ncbi:MAG TPA: hypothetical protein VGG64_15020, partial [Pirellulales bacterium]